jgi:hypothetical protein
MYSIAEMEVIKVGYCNGAPLLPFGKKMEDGPGE